MIKQITVNTKALETMLFIWASLKDKEKIADEFFINLAESPEMEAAYADDFDPNSLRRALSAIANRELLSDAGVREKKFWNNNMWMTEDLGFTEMMVEPVKTLNMDKYMDRLPEDFPHEKVEVIFYPGTLEDATIIGSKLFINFFKVKVDMFNPEEEAKIGEDPIPEFVIKEIAKMK